MNRINSFNQKLAEKITNFVSTMWCAYIFAAIALISLPAALTSGNVLVIVAWVAQTFLQLVLLSIIMVGQRSGADDVAKKISETHDAAITELAELRIVADEIARILKDVESKK
jgi:hypothetical protein